MKRGWVGIGLGVGASGEFVTQSVMTNVCICVGGWVSGWGGGGYASLPAAT